MSSTEERKRFASVFQTLLSAAWCHCDASFSSPSLSQLAVVPSILTHQIANLWRLHRSCLTCLHVFLYISRIREKQSGLFIVDVHSCNWFRCKLLSRRPFKCNSRLAPWWLWIVILTESERATSMALWHFMHSLTAWMPHFASTECGPLVMAFLTFRNIRLPPPVAVWDVWVSQLLRWHGAPKYHGRRAT